MKVSRTVLISLNAISRNKMRSFLTALGIIIGVGAVITMVSIGQGAKRAVEDRFESMGTNLIFVHSHSRSVRGRSGAGTYINLTEADAKAIAEKCDAVKYVSPTVSGRAQVIYGNKNWNTSIQGVGAVYPVIRNWDMEEGIFFDEIHVKTGAKVCVLGPEVKKNLFKEESRPIGKIIRINKIPFKIIGVLKAKGQSGGWFNRDDMILMPFKTAQKRLLGIDYINSIDISAVSAIRAQEAARQVEELLLIRHKIAPDAEHDFHIGDMTEIAEGAAESTQIMTNLLGGIALVSLIVGGIGIMNIMLVSVTERIREIGIRMSVGAKERDILLQFLTEAVVLSILGGTLGVGIGIVASKLTSQISGWDTLISPISIALAFLFSATVGIFFGFYPAHKASKLDPIEALRYE